MSTNTTEMELENRTQSAIIWTNSNDSAWGCSQNASLYVIMPEDKEGLRDCSPCVLESELDVSSNAKYLVNCMGIHFSLLMLVVCQIICNSNSRLDTGHFFHTSLTQCLVFLDIEAVAHNLRLINGRFPTLSKGQLILKANFLFLI